MIFIVGGPITFILLMLFTAMTREQHDNLTVADHYFLQESMKDPAFRAAYVRHKNENKIKNLLKETFIGLLQAVLISAGIISVVVGIIVLGAR